MARLARLRFVSVGHTNARLPDVSLDLRDASGDATDSTLWLRNGGGKSSILNLFFALVRPDRREFLGGKADSKRRRLEDYVLPGDHAVVVSEWQLDPEAASLELEGARRKLITGVFYEWRSGGGDDSRLRRLFFSGIAGPPGSPLAFDSLPLFVDSQENGGGRRRRTLSGFRQEWQALRDRFPHLQVAATENQREWQELLEASGIDPELFSYQIRMNQREGAADEMFRFDEHEEFADFLLEVALDPELGNRVSRNIDTYRRELRERKDQWLPERELVTGLVERLAPLAELAEERRAKLAAAAQARSELAALRAHAGERKAQLEERARTLARRHAEEADAAGAASRQALDQRRRAAAFEVLAANTRLADAESEYEKAQRRVQEARRARRVWEAAIPLRNARRAENTARERQRELEQKRSEHAPLRRRLEEVAVRFAAALERRAARLRAQAKEASATAAQSRATEAEKREAAAECKARAARSEAEAAQLEEVLAQGEAARKGLEEEGVLGPGETASEGVERLERTLEGCEEKRARHLEEDETTRRRLAEVQESIESTSAALEQASVRLEESERRLAEATGRRRTLEERPLLREALELETVDIDRAAGEAVRVLEGMARHAFEEVVELRIERVEDDRAVAHLEEQGLLPPRRDVERLLGVLREHLPSVWSGWTYLSENSPRGDGSVLETVRRDPELALGIVVRDVDYDKAKEILAGLDGARLPDLPVAVAPQAALGAGRAGDPVPACVVGPRSRAHYDRGVAQRELIARRERLDASRERIDRFEARRDEVETLCAEVREFRRLYPAGWFAEQEQQVAGQRELEERRRSELDSLRETKRALSERADALRGELAALDAERHGFELSLQRVREHLERHERPQAGRRQRLDGARQRGRSARQDEEARLEEARQAAEAAGHASEAAGRIGEDARSTEDERRHVHYLPADRGEAVPEGTVESLRRSYGELRDQYEQKVGAEGLLALSRESEKQAEEERGRLAKILEQQSLDEGEVARALDGLAEGDSAEEAHDRAVESENSAFGTLGNLHQVVSRAKERLERAQADSQELGDAVELGDEAAALTPEQADAEVESSRKEAVELERRRGEHQERAEQVERERHGVARRGELLANELSRLETISTAYRDLLEAIPDLPEDGAPGEEAPRALPAEGEIGGWTERIDKTLDTAREDLVSLDARRREGTRRVKEWAGEERFEALRTRWVRHVAMSAEEDLEEHAGTWAGELELRLRHIDEQLAEIGKHRDLLVNELSSAASEALALLRSAANHSRLPEHLPGLGGAQFLRVTLNEPKDPSEQRGRLGALIDDLVEQGEGASGVGLVQKAVRRLARPIRFRVLCPDPNLERRSVDITEMQRFSGGEQLTGAILLYCTLAQVRARSRGVGRRPSSVLLLDNPIGRASRVRFLELQREVARSMGVQLVYTTAVNDHEALRTLPNVIRLRNERVDRNRGHRVVEAEGEGRHEDGAESAERGRGPRDQPLHAIEAARLAREDEPAAASGETSADDTGTS